MCFPLRFLEACNYSPIEDFRNRSCDTITYHAIETTASSLVHNEYHNLEAIAWQSYPQITNFRLIARRYGATEELDPFKGLDKFYSKKLIDDMKRFYVNRTRKVGTYIG